jgi:aryl-alcohol dehydrogenase-like predicted oxidoreductase
VARELGRSIPQVAINWVLQRPGVSSVIIGARDEAQLRQNLEAASFRLDAALMRRLDAASEVPPVYPYWHQRRFPELNPPPV